MSEGTPSAGPAIYMLASLGAEWKESVEQLLFFNPRQAALRDRILESVQLFGSPKIRIAGDKIRITLGGDVEPGSFYALAEHGDEAELAGLILYVRRNTGLDCLYLSIEEEYSSRGEFRSHKIALNLIESVIKVGRRIQGVDHIEIYNRDRWCNIPVSWSLL